MKSWQYALTVPLALAAVAVPSIRGAAPAHAQISPLPQPTTAPGPTQKPEGVAEQAEEGPDAMPSTPVLSADTSKNKQFELFTIDGYFRFRTDWFKNFHLGFSDTALGGAPFPRSLGCNQDPAIGAPCEETIKSANMRLRLEPRISLSEGTAVFAQIDVLDNIVAGSTPDGTFWDGTAAPGHIPLRGFSGGQAAPEAGRNALTDSIIVRRAWAEVETDIGQVAFGRMPWHFGLGILANAGGHDPFSGHYDWDGDFGDSVDRVQYKFNIPGTDLAGSVATDWSSTTPVSGQDGRRDNQLFGQPSDLEDNDDVSQWVIGIARFDKPDAFRERVNRGGWVLNYGLQFLYTRQNAESVPGTGPGDVTFRPRELTSYTPDVWFKAARDKLTVELEGVGVLGTIGRAEDLGRDLEESISIRQFGGVGRMRYRAMKNKMLLGMEVGFASGDQYDNDQPGETHVSNAVLIPPGEFDDNTVSRFIFDLDYKVDMILFRELLGAVSNATYFRPSVRYDITDRLFVDFAGILSFANVPVATPGNAAGLGAELNGHLGYRNGGFFAGISYGVLFPLGGMNHPDSADQGGPGYGFGNSDVDDAADLNLGDAKTAQTIQTKLVLQF